MENPNIGEERVYGHLTFAWTGEYWVNSAVFAQQQETQAQSMAPSVEMSVDQNTSTLQPEAPTVQSAGLFSVDTTETSYDEQPQGAIFPKAKEVTEAGRAVDAITNAAATEKKKRFWKRVRGVGAAAILAVSGVFGGTSLFHADEASSTPEVRNGSKEKPSSTQHDNQLHSLASQKRAEIQPPQEGGLIRSQSIISVEPGDTVSKIVLEDIFGAESVQSDVMDATIQSNQILHQIFLDGMKEFQESNTDITNLDRIHAGQTLNVGGYSEEFLQKVEQGKKAYQLLKAQG